MKTPDEIKNALANCNKLRYCPYCEDHCPYKAHDLSCLRNLHADAREYIGQLEADREQLLRDLSQCTPWSEPIKMRCSFCAHKIDSIHCKFQSENRIVPCESWEWRGIKEEKQC